MCMRVCVCRCLPRLLSPPVSVGPVPKQSSLSLHFPLWSTMAVGNSSSSSSGSKPFTKKVVKEGTAVEWSDGDKVRIERESKREGEKHPSGPLAFHIIIVCVASVCVYLYVCVCVCVCVCVYVRQADTCRVEKAEHPRTEEERGEPTCPWPRPFPLPEPTEPNDDHTRARRVLCCRHSIASFLESELKRVYDRKARCCQAQTCVPTVTLSLSRCISACDC